MWAFYRLEKLVSGCSQQEGTPTWLGGEANVLRLRTMNDLYASYMA